jgi:hypothetical protein
MNEKLIEKTMRDCPICDQTHLIEKWQRESEAIIKDTTVQFQEVFYRCTNSDEEENEFVSGGMMSENLLRAKMAYNLLENGKLHIYTNEHDWFVAKDIDDLKFVIAQYYGETIEEIERYIDEWRMISPKGIVAVKCTDDDYKHGDPFIPCTVEFIFMDGFSIISDTAENWAVANGVGFFCFSEYGQNIWKKEKRVKKYFDIKIDN